MFLSASILPFFSLWVEQMVAILDNLAAKYNSKYDQADGLSTLPLALLLTVTNGTQTKIKVPPGHQGSPRPTVYTL